MAHVAACGLVAASARGSDVEPAVDDRPVTAAFEEEGILLGPGTGGVLPEIEVIPEGVPVEQDSVLVAPPLATPTTAEPGILDVASPGADGMLLEDFRLDEMPYEASSGDWFWNGGWYVGAESLWLDRSRVDRKVIVEEFPVAGERQSKFTTMAQPFNIAPGARVTIGKSLGRDYLDRDRSLEFVYYGGLAYRDTDGRNGLNGNSLFTPLAPLAPGFTAASGYTTSFRSGFNSWEWNYKLRRRLGRDQLVMSPGGNWTRHAERGWLPALILGIRTANVDEHFGLNSFREGVPSSDFSGTYRINTNNWLLGMNIGGELISQNEFYYWGLRGRAAPALCFADTSSWTNGVNTVGPAPIPTGSIAFSNSNQRSAAGFIGDLTLLAGWQIKPNFSLQAGYDFLWVAGIATADRQYNLNRVDRKAVNLGGQTFYNGLSFGFNGSW